MAWLDQMAQLARLDLGDQAQGELHSIPNGPLPEPWSKSPLAGSNRDFPILFRLGTLRQPYYKEEVIGLTQCKFFSLLLACSDPLLTTDLSIRGFVADTTSVFSSSLSCKLSFFSSFQIHC